MADRGLMDRVRHFFGLPHTAPSMSTEQEAVSLRQKIISARLDQRQRAIDLQIDVLQADRRDARRPRG